MKNRIIARKKLKELAKITDEIKDLQARESELRTYFRNTFDVNDELSIISHTILKEERGSTQLIVSNKEIYNQVGRTAYINMSSISIPALRDFLDRKTFKKLTVTKKNEFIRLIDRRS